MLENPTPYTLGDGDSKRERERGKVDGTGLWADATVALTTWNGWFRCCFYGKGGAVSECGWWAETRMFWRGSVNFLELKMKE